MIVKIDTPLFQKITEASTDEVYEELYERSLAELADLEVASVLETDPPTAAIILTTPLTPEQEDLYAFLLGQEGAKGYIYNLATEGCTAIPIQGTTSNAICGTSLCPGPTTCPFDEDVEFCYYYCTHCAAVTPDKAETHTCALCGTKKGANTDEY